MFGEGTGTLLAGMLLGAASLAAAWVALEHWQRRRRGMVTKSRYRDICEDCGVASSHLLGGRWEAESHSHGSTYVALAPRIGRLTSTESNLRPAVSGATCRDCFRTTGIVSPDCGQCDGTGIDPMPPTDVRCDGCGHVLLADEDPVFRGEAPYHEMCAEGVDRAVAADAPDREVYETR